MCRTPTQLLLLNSKDRQTGTINNATYKLGIPMVKISKARLENFTILNSFYAISATNGSFTVAESLGPTAVITIPPGTYDTVQFAAAIQAQLNAAGLGNTYTVTVDPVTLKLEIEATGALDPFVLSWVSGTSASYPMGWGTTLPAPTAQLLTQTSPFTVGLTNLNKLLIRLTVNSAGGPLWCTSSANGNFLVDVDVNFGSVYSYVPQIETSNCTIFCPPVDSSVVGVELIDAKTGQRADTNGQEYQLELALWGFCEGGSD